MSPDDRRYTQEHEWILVEDQDSKRALAGITDFAQKQLGDIVYFELPKVGDTVTHMGKLGEVESVKAVHPELTNNDPFGAGWLIRIAVADLAEIDSLMSAAEYDAYTAGLS